MDLLATDQSASQISDKIKDMLFAKSAEKIQNIRPDVAASVFGGVNDEDVEGVEEVSVDTEEE